MEKKGCAVLTISQRAPAASRGRKYVAENTRPGLLLQVRRGVIAIEALSRKSKTSPEAR